MRNLLRKLLNRSIEPPFVITEITPEHIEFPPESIAAAKWWGDRLQELGDASQPPSMMQIGYFEIALCKLISQELATLGPNAEVVIYNDYHPSALLGDALRTAGIRDTFLIFPWRTSMIVGNGSVRVKLVNEDGYRNIRVP